MIQSLLLPATADRPHTVVSKGLRSTLEVRFSFPNMAHGVRDQRDDAGREYQSLSIQAS